MNKRGRGRPNLALSRAIQWFKDHGAESSLSACVDGADVSIGTARNARQALKNSGHLAEHFSPNEPGAGRSPASKTDLPPTLAGHPLSSAVPSPAPLSTDSLDELEHELERSLSTLPSKDALTRAWEMHDRSNSEQIKVACLRIVASLTSGQQDPRDLGPGPPLTLDARLHRGALVLAACGREHAPEIWRRAFNEQIVDVNVLPPPAVEDDIPGDPLPEITAPTPLPGAPIAPVIEAA